MTRIMVTSAGGALAPLNIRLLKASCRRKVDVVAVDARADAVGQYFADRFARVPHGDDPAYGDAILELVTRHRIDVVLPWSDEEAFALSADRDRLAAAGAVLTCSDYATLQVMGNKAATMACLAQNGIRTPEWRIVSGGSALDEALADLRERLGEAVIKPLRSRGARDTWVIRNDIAGQVDWHGSREVHVDWRGFEREHRPTIDADQPIMVMERLFPPALDIDILAMGGRVVRAVPRERLNPSGIPFRGSRFRFSAPLLELADRVTKAFALSWLYDYDLMSTHDGQPVVIEVNPRPSGSIAASIMAGIPFYEDLLDLVEGVAPPPVDLPTDGCVVVPYTDCLIAGVR